MQVVNPNSPVANNPYLSDILQRIAYGGKLTVRLQALKDLKHILSNDDGHEEIYLNALDSGADRMLAWQLTQHINKERKEKEIIWMVLKCLELLWARCPNERLIKSAHDLIDVLPWLVHSWHSFLDDSSVVELVLSIFRIWSKIKDSQVKTKLIRSGVVKCIEQEASSSIRNDKRGILTLGLIKDFAFRASGPEKEYLYVALKNMILHNCKSDQPSIVEAMTATLWNLAAETNIGRSMAEDQSVWNILSLLTNAWRTTEGMVVFRNVTSIIGTIVAIVVSDENDSTSTDLLQKQTWIVASLLDTLKTESDSDLRRRCTRTIRCLVSRPWGRSFMLRHADSIHITDLLLSLVKNDCNDIDTRIQACQAVRSMLLVNTEIPMRVQTIGDVLILILGERNVDSKLAVGVFQTLSMIIRDKEWKPDLSSFSDIFLPKISSILRLRIDETTSNLVISQFLLEFIRIEDYPFEYYPDSSQKILLDCITSLLEPMGPDFEYSKKFVVEIVTTLASNRETKRVLAGHDRLLTALVNFCLLTNGPMKTNLKAVILTLVPEL